MRRAWRVALVVGVLVAVFAATSAGAAKFITGDDIQNGSISLKDLSKRAKRALKGRVGPAGPAGAAGPQGPAGPSSLSTTVRTEDFTADSSGETSGEVRCPDGMVAVGGSVSPGRRLYVVTDLPSPDGRGWVGTGAFGVSGDFMRIAVICTPGTATVLPLGS